MPNGKTKGNREPTPQQRKAFELMEERVGKTPYKKIKKGEILLQAGYSKQIAKNPAKVMNSAGWQKLLDEKLSEKKLTAVHAKLLGSKKEIIQLKALELGYKLRKKLGNDGDTDPNGVTETLEAVVIRVRKLLPE